MFGSRFFTFLTIALAGATVVSAAAGGPVVARYPGSGAVEAVAAKKDVRAQVFDVFTNLKGIVDPILANINTIVDSGVITDAAVDPLVIQITNALNVASAALAQIDPESTVASLATRQNNPDLSSLIAGIINSITTTLNRLVPSLANLPLLGGLLAGLDVALNQVLRGLEILLQGVLRLVARLLINVAQLLHDLGLALSLATLRL